MPHKPSFRTPLSPQKSPQAKNATRHESHLNALLGKFSQRQLTEALFWQRWEVEVFIDSYR